MGKGVAFSSLGAAAELEALTEAELDDLEFGVVRLDREGTVKVFNKTEAVRSGYKSRPAIDRDFFLEIAPCMSKPEMKGRIDRARQEGDVDIEIGWVGDFDDPDGEIRIRAISASDGGLWILLERDDDE
jgi:photoactive yellow protein